MLYWVFIYIFSDVLSAGIGFFIAKVKWNAPYRRRLKRAITFLHDGARAIASRDESMNIHDFVTFHYKKLSVRQSSLDVFSRLQACFDKDRLYLRHDLTVADVARVIGSNRSYVSRAVQLHAKCSFPIFVSRYRINYSMSLMQKNPALRVADVAFMCGFNSAGAFSSTFRDVVGVPPGRWTKEYHHKASGKEQGNERKEGWKIEHNPK